MQMIFQVIKAEDGSRCEPFIASREELAKKLIDAPPSFDALVLVLCDDVKGEFSISRAPLLSVPRFIELFGASNHGREILSAAAE